MPTNPKLIRDHFLAAAELPGSEREAYLAAQCGYDAELRAAVERLLVAHEQPATILNQPVVGDPTRSLLPDEQPGTIIAARYKLIEAIGEGGMGTVWMAEQKEPVKRRVAIKLVKAGMDSRQVLARFAAERQALALMDHPNIAKVLDGGVTEQGRPFFAMEYVKGVPLTQYCDQAKLSLRERLHLFVSVCQAVQHAHQKGVIHRDLKPSNILICLYDGQPVPKVIDFGLAKAMHQPLTDQSIYTAHGMMVGTPLYMSPEQAEHNNLDVDTRTDIYSLGVILYELLTGSTPLERQQLKDAALAEVLRLIKEVEPPKPSTRLSDSAQLPSIAAHRRLEPRQLQKSVVGDLDWIVMKALDKERRRRYETANGLARDIERFLSEEPVEACPPSTAYKVRKYVRRNQRKVAAVGLLLAALFAGLSGTTWGLVKARRQQARAEAGEKLAGERLVEAESQRQRSEEALQVTQAVSDFLQHKLLSQADVEAQAEWLLQSEGSLGRLRRNPTVEELLDRAATELSSGNIEESFPGQPLVQAAILSTVGQAYLNIGQPGHAREFLERSTALYEEFLGPNNETTLLTRSALALAFNDLSQFADAVTLAEENYTRFREHLGATDTNTLMALGNLASFYRRLGQVRKAPPLLKQAFEAHLEANGPNDRHTLGAMSQLAIAYNDVGQFDKAFALFQEVFERRRNIFGAEHPRTQISMHFLAQALLHRGRYDEGVQVLQELVSLRRKVYGEDDLKALDASIFLGSGLLTAGRQQEAVRLLERTHQRYRELFGDANDNTIVSISLLAESYRAVGRTKEAVSLSQQVLEHYRKRYGDEHPITIHSLQGLATALLDDGRSIEALPMLRKILEQTRGIYGSEHTATIKAMCNLAIACRQNSQLDEAVQLHEQALDLYRQVLGTDHPSVAQEMANLAVAYREIGKVDEALRMHKDAFELHKKVLSHNHPDVLHTMVGLASSLQSSKQLDQALSMFESALEMQTEVLGAAHDETLRTMHNLATAYLDARQLDKALPLMEKAFKLRSQVLGPENRATITSMSRLAAICDALGDGNRAILIYEQTLELRRKVLGRNHPDTLRTQHELGVSYYSAGRFDKAIELYEDLTKTRLELNGRDDVATKRSMGNLGMNYKAAGRIAEAIPLLKECYEASRQVPNLRFVRNTLLDAYVETGDAPHATSLVKELLAEARPTLAANKLQWADLLVGQAVKLLVVGAWDDAEALLGECLALREQLAADDWRTFSTKSLLGAARLGKQNYADAEPLLLAGYEGLKLREEKIPEQGKARIPEALDRLIKLYTATDRPDEARKWQAERDKYLPADASATKKK